MSKKTDGTDPWAGPKGFEKENILVIQSDLFIP